MSLDFPKIEEKILRFWQEKKIFEKLRKKNQGKEHWSFLDGPITANNPMGVHHAWGRTYKDIFQRYKAMQGRELRFQNGFDCQGLHVEVEVEKELGFKNKKDIEKYGIDKFVEKCKERVKKYSKIQTEQSIRLGQWMDWDNSYYTMSDENNYAIWGFLKKCRQRGLLYKGRDVVPWCPRCGTAISQHEILTEEYKEITHKAIFVKLPVINKKNTFFLVWTTTPWTLPANVALAVHPELIYAEVQDKNRDIFIILKEKANLIAEGKILKEFPGKELKGLVYQGMFDELQKTEHRVILWKDVTSEEGTGIVHIASGCGQEDFKLSKEFNLSVIDPTNEESRYKKGFGFLTGKLVSQVNDLIFDNLAKKNLVFKIEDYKHRYPTCWRCKTELIFRLVDEWYISMEKLRKPLIVVAKKIEWIPSFGLERELDWLKNMQDWLISKKRYWGLALPIYECSCGNFEVIGSKEELKEKTVKGWDKFNDNSPHRPWIDEIKIKCSKCGKLVSRIPDVGNPWLDAGIVPFSTMTKEWFPADLVCESFPGQFKNWFYSIIVMSMVLENVAPVKTIFGYASVRDEKGEEMHKSKGNAIWFDDAVEKIGADPMRWMYARQNPEYNLNFGYKAADEIKRKLLTLWNSFAFFITYVDKKDYPSQVLKPKPKDILDIWIVSRLNNLIEKVTRNLERYNVSVATLAIEKFFINDLSLWYVRRSRRRFHAGAKDREEAIATLYYVLLNLSKLIAPFTPFIAEELYQCLGGEKESVHLEEYPEPNKKLINKELEEKMIKIRGITTEVLAQRAKAGIKVRQPLASLQIKNKLEKDLLEPIKEEANVKKIVFGKELKLNTKITKGLKEEGVVREVIRHIQEMRKKAGLKPKDKILVQGYGIKRLNKILTQKKDFIKKETLAEDFKIGKAKTKFGLEKELKVDGEKLKIGINKL
ncbi:MAG: isoleucine--tRNA ligase [Candidatus Nealsonbacteria bacterium CG10_big_fil_rev_8_21_14_0_10_36_24]|uniref:Isoleucine--tRNA ligase n=2 Tax=Candidatus Nealsoniibacteriota TaxID=1817911 RepID=A0A2H0YR87_9BACT|nr:MAG: isoleucine--tRNA ligase [Candidatus Nealsonbacteria bacterium CG10_big_fil_rev_8_21_14_0_10_36_24]PIS40263.1 MAG: isoleucine--tRNA ligase [Candidatus Nealsonbacteria bacterium CG08_land_8_20_14_0_20_36_22]